MIGTELMADLQVAACRVKASAVGETPADIALKSGCTVLLFICSAHVFMAFRGSEDGGSADANEGEREE